MHFHPRLSLSASEEPEWVLLVDQLLTHAESRLVTKATGHQVGHV